MVRKTRKSHSYSKKDEGIMSIPELRQSFEHIEHFITSMKLKGESKSEMIKGLCKEWRAVFHKDLPKKSAEEYIEHVIATKKNSRKTTRKSGGASASATPIAGSPIGYTTHAGLYTAPGEGYGIYTKYVNDGFSNPEPAYKLDSAIGNAQYVTHTPKGMGDNTVSFKGGKRSTHSNTRKVRRGGGVLNTVQQLFSRPIPASSPPSIMFDAKTAFHSDKLGPSPDQVQRQPDYMLGKVMPQAVKINLV